MTPDRWQQVEELYQAARDPEKRAEVLAQADPELGSEVEALLAQAEGDAPQAPITILTNWQAGLKK